MQPVGVGSFRNGGSDAGQGAEHSFITSHILFRFSIVYELQLECGNRDLYRYCLRNPPSPLFPGTFTLSRTK